MEIVDRHDTNTYRAVYTVQFSDVVYVLHAFQKKSKRGVATPRRTLNSFAAGWQTPDGCTRKAELKWRRRKKTEYPRRKAAATSLPTLASLTLNRNSSRRA